MGTTLTQFYSMDSKILSLTPETYSFIVEFMCCFFFFPKSTCILQKQFKISQVQLDIQFLLLNRMVTEGLPQQSKHSLVGKLSSHIPYGQKSRTENRKNIVTNSIKAVKMVHMKNKQKKKLSIRCQRIFRSDTLVLNKRKSVSLMNMWKT